MKTRIPKFMRNLPWTREEKEKLERLFKEEDKIHETRRKMYVTIFRRIAAEKKSLVCK